MIQMMNDHLSTTATILGPKVGRCTQVWLYLNYTFLNKLLLYFLIRMIWFYNFNDKSLKFVGGK